MILLNDSNPAFGIQKPNLLLAAVNSSSNSWIYFNSILIVYSWIIFSSKTNNSHSIMLKNYENPRLVPFEIQKPDLRIRIINKLNNNI